MANTEKITVLQLVRDTKDQVREARRDPSLSNDANEVLEESYNLLDEVEGDIILSDIDACIQALKSDASKLENISANIRQKIAKLSNIADAVQKAANSIKTLVDILSKVGTLGGS